jgi:hypothetical protein
MKVVGSGQRARRSRVEMRRIGKTTNVILAAFPALSLRCCAQTLSRDFVGLPNSANFLDDSLLRLRGFLNRIIQLLGAFREAAESAGIVAGHSRHSPSHGSGLQAILPRLCFFKRFGSM